VVQKTNSPPSQGGAGVVEKKQTPHLRKEAWGWLKKTMNAMFPFWHYFLTQSNPKNRYSVQNQKRFFKKNFKRKCLPFVLKTDIP
jgi:hypothetical protein